MAEDAFGGEAVETQSDAEVFETEQATPQGAVLEVETAQEQETTPDWREQIEDEALREKVGSKYGSPTELAKAYAELETRFGSQGNEIAQLRDMVTEMLGNGARQPDYGPMPQNGQQAQQQGPPDFSMVNDYAAQVARQVRSGEMDAEEGMAQIAYAQSQVYEAQLEARTAAIQQALEERINQSLAPVQSFQTQQAMGGQINALKRQYGDEGYAGLAPKAAEYLRQWGATDPNFVQNPGAIQTAFDRAAADAYREGRRAASAHTLDGSGPGQAPRTVDPAALILEGIDQAGAHASGDYF